MNNFVFIISLIYSVFCVYNNAVNDIINNCMSRYTRIVVHAQCVISINGSRTRSMCEIWFSHAPDCGQHVPPLSDQRPATYWVQHTTSCIAQSKAPQDGQNCCPKHVELNWIYQ